MLKPKQLIIKKSDLRSGMKLKLSNGNIYTLLSDYPLNKRHCGAMFNATAGYVPMDNYSEDLEYNVTVEKSDENLDIVAIYEAKEPKYVLSDNLNNFDIIWVKPDSHDKVFIKALNKLQSEYDVILGQAQYINKQEISIYFYMPLVQQEVKLIFSTCEPITADMIYEELVEELFNTVMLSVRKEYTF